MSLQFTTALQPVVVHFYGSVVLLADMVRKFFGALTVVPLRIAFVFVGRAASSRLWFGLGRVDGLAGFLIVPIVALLSVAAARCFWPAPGVFSMFSTRAVLLPRSSRTKPGLIVTTRGRRTRRTRSFAGPASLAMSAFKNSTWRLSNSERSHLKLAARLDPRGTLGCDGEWRLETIMAMRFYVGNNTSGDPSWWLFGANDEMAAWAGETFASESNARRAALAFKAGAATASYEVYADTGGSWRWRARRASDKAAASGESFDSKSNAERAAVNVRDNARYAPGP